jgi:hypothetical protein
LIEVTIMQLFVAMLCQRVSRIALTVLTREHVWFPHVRLATACLVYSAEATPSPELHFPDNTSGMVALELGAGTGIVGITAALCGAQVMRSAIDAPSHCMPRSCLVLSLCFQLRRQSCLSRSIVIVFAALSASVALHLHSNGSTWLYLTCTA